MFRKTLLHVIYTVVALLFVNAFFQSLESAVSFSGLAYAVYLTIKALSFILVIFLSVILFEQIKKRKQDDVQRFQSPVNESSMDNDKRTAHDMTPVYSDECLEDCPIISTEEEFLELNAEHPLIAQFSEKVKGVTFCNDDGSSRQEILSCCYAGQRIWFRRYTHEGNPAFAVVTDYGEIGNLPNELAESLDYSFGPEAYLSGTIGEIVGGYDGLNYGCVLDISVYGPKYK